MIQNFKTFDAKDLKKWYIICGRGKTGKTCISAGYAILLSQLIEHKVNKHNSLLSAKCKSIYFNEDDKFDVVEEIKKNNKKLDQSSTCFAHEDNDKNVQSSSIDHKKILLVSINESESLSQTLKYNLKIPITKITPYLHVLNFDMNDTLINTEKSISENEYALSPILNSIIELPGIREILYFSEIMKHAGSYDHIIVDTWPAFSTINFLSFPEELSTLLNKIVAMDDCQSLYNTNLYKEVSNAEHIIKNENIFENSYLNLICTPDTISINETHKLLNQLELCDVKVNNLIINQVLKKSNNPCKNCEAIMIKQRNIIDSMDIKDTKLIEIDFLPDGIGGLENLKLFAMKYL